MLEFNRHARARDGLSSWCSACVAFRSRVLARSPERLAAKKWTDMNRRAGNADGRNPSYAAVRVLMTRDQFLAWAVPAIRTFMGMFPGVSPSVDRVDPHGDYELSNLRIISRQDNLLRAWHAGNIPDRKLSGA